MFSLSEGTNSKTPNVYKTSYTINAERWVLGRSTRVNRRAVFESPMTALFFIYVLKISHVLFIALFHSRKCMACSRGPMIGHFHAWDRPVHDDAITVTISYPRFNFQFGEVLNYVMPTCCWSQ